MVVPCLHQGDTVVHGVSSLGVCLPIARTRVYITNWAQQVSCRQNPGTQGQGSDGSPLALGTVDHDLDDDDDVIGRATRDVPMQIGSHPRAAYIYHNGYVHQGVGQTLGFSYPSHILTL